MEIWQCWFGAIAIVPRPPLGDWWHKRGDRHCTFRYPVFVFFFKNRAFYKTCFMKKHVPVRLMCARY